MESNPHNKQTVTLLIAAATALIPAAALAATAPDRRSAAPESADARLGENARPTAVPPAVGQAQRSYPAMQRGVRQAAEQGPQALRRYIERTRMIYNYYYWDFAKRN
jgi:hypothetical protein